METVHACARLMDSGLEVNLLVKVRFCCMYLHYTCTYMCWHSEEAVIENDRLFMIVSSIAVPCGTLNNPTNGQVNVEGNTFGSESNYSCSEGYVLNGNSTRMCQADGQWSGSEPICEG